MQKNVNEKKQYISPEDVLEFLYEICDKWKEEDNPIESMKKELRIMIRCLKEEKFNSLREELGLD